MRLSHKLALVFSLFGAILAAGFQYRQTRILRREMYGRMEGMARVTFSAVGALVSERWRGGRVPQLGRNFDALVREVDVASLVVKDLKGRRLLGRADDSASRQRQPHPGLPLERVSDGYYDLAQEVPLGAKGSVMVEMSFHMDKLDARLQEIARLGVRDGVMAFLAITLAAWFIGSFFGLSLERLLPRLEELAHDPERFRPIRNMSSGDEVSRLIAAFNSLGSTLKAETRRRRELELEKIELAAMLVHDLKTPLTVISSGASLLEDYFLESTSAARRMTQRQETAWHRAFELLNQSVDRLRRMVEDVLELSRMEEVKGLRARAIVDLAALTRAATRDFEIIAKERGKRMVLELTNGFSAVVSGDEALLRRVLDNLVHNAIEHTPTGSAVTIRVEPDSGSVPRSGTVPSHDSLEWDGVKVSVSDAGPGIPEVAREEIFKKFFQSDLKRHLGNVGLGLALCHKVVERHGGSIGVEDAKPRGACFYFILPSAEAS